MKTLSKLFLPAVAATFFFVSCSDDDVTLDTQKPAIQVLEPHDEEEVAPGEEINFQAVFTDNVALASYKIEIHDAFDDHTHGVLKSSHQSNPWSWSQVFDIPAGLTRFEAVQNIMVPTEVNGSPISEGHYHFGVYVTDAAGNEEQFFMEVHIEDDHHDDDDQDHDHD